MNDTTVLQNYESSSESETEREIVVKKRKNKVPKNWVHAATFESAEEAKQALKNDKTWSFSFSNKTE